MKNRYSVRNFSDKKVEDEKIAAILEAGRIAPTACHYNEQLVMIPKHLQKKDISDLVVYESF